MWLIKAHIFSHILHTSVWDFTSGITEQRFQNRVKWYIHIHVIYSLNLGMCYLSVQVSRSVMSNFFVTSQTAAHQASLSITNSWSLFKLMSIKWVMTSNHLILCCSLLLLPSILPSIRVFSNSQFSHQVVKVLEHQSFQA